jgi:hypothetical protein
MWTHVAFKNQRSHGAIMDDDKRCVSVKCDMHEKHV